MINPQAEQRVVDAAPKQLMVSWGLSEVLTYLRYLELRGRLREVEGRPIRWSVA